MNLNVAPKVRDHEGRVIRDWVASNVAETGFWHMVQDQYRATQIVFECKNYRDLSASDFHQAEYYMNNRVGNFVIICFRGERSDIDKHYEHIRRIAVDKQGLVLLLTDQDIKVFVRQAMNGKVKEDHIRERFDSIVRAIS